ncbi:MAG: hypothetical protein RIR76_3342 [Verrucomicrobiota bacterium]|jgi:hypothetical protein
MKRFIASLLIAVFSAGTAFAQSATVTSSDTTYASTGGQITFNVTMTYPAGAVPSFSAKPPGGAWAYVSAAGTNVPSVPPQAGETTDPTDPDSVFGFTYSAPPSGSASFSFVMSYPAGISGNQTVTFSADYRLNGVRTPLSVAAITLTSGSSSSTVPVISTQPQSQTVTAGAAVTFSVGATGTAPLAYQWKKGTVDIVGATNSSYSISATVSADAGSYFVTVSNGSGAVTSNAASLIVSAASSSPYSVTASSSTYSTSGGQITFNVTMTYPAGAVPSFSAKPPGAAWAYVSASGSNVPSVPPQVGETTDPTDPDSAFGFTYSAPPSGSASFSFVLSYPSGLSGNQIVSLSADYRLNGVRTAVSVPAITLTAQTGGGTVSAPSISGPTTASATVGTAFSYAITASNSPTSYGATGMPAGLSLAASTGVISGTPTAAGTSNVSLTATNAGGTSAAFSLVLSVAKATGTVTITPATLAQTYNGSPRAVAATTTPASLNVIFTYQPTGGVASQAAPINAGTYAVAATIDSPNHQGSASGTLNVAKADQTITFGTLPAKTVGDAAFTLSGTAPGGTVSYTSSNTAVATVSGNIVTLVGAGTTSIVASQSGGTNYNAATDAPQALTVNPAAVGPSISTQPQSQSVTAGASVTFSVVAAGTAPLSYQWKKGTADISGATNSSYTIPATVSADAGSYFVTVSNSAGNVTSNAASLTVTTASSFAFSQHPVAITRSRGETASFQVNATGGTGTVTYKWYKDGTALSDSFGRISGSGTQTLVISNVGVADGGSYSATATTVQNGTITSNGAALTVLSGPTITRPALDAAVLAAGSASFSVAATGSGALTYQWYFTPAAGGTTTPLADITSKIAGATTSTLTVSSVQKPNDEGFYSCSVTDSAGTARSTGSLSVVSRVLKISAPNAVPGADVVVSVLLQANGDENAANFAIVFDPSKLTYKAFAAGAQSDSGSASVPAGTTGRLNLLVGKTPPDVWAAGSNEIARITFTSAATGGTSLVGFGDISASSPRSVSSATGQTLLAGYQGAYVSSISGLEGDIDGDGKLTAADWTAMGRIVLGLDPAPTGEKFMRTDCAPRTGTGGALQLGDKLFNAADWTQVGRYVLGLDSVTNIGGPSGP